MGLCSQVLTSDLDNRCWRHLWRPMPCSGAAAGPAEALYRNTMQRPTLRRHLGMSRMAALAARIMLPRSSAARRARPSGRPASKGRCTASCRQKAQCRGCIMQHRHVQNGRMGCQCQICYWHHAGYRLFPTREVMSKTVTSGWLCKHVSKPQSWLSCLQQPAPPTGGGRRRRRRAGAAGRSAAGAGGRPRRRPPPAPASLSPPTCSTNFVTVHQELGFRAGLRQQSECGLQCA